MTFGFLRTNASMAHCTNTKRRRLPPETGVTPLRDQLQTTLRGSFTLKRQHGGGGMSRVFVAGETALGRKVVIKVQPSEERRCRRSWRRC